MPAHVPRAIRLTFSYRGAQVDLQSSRRVEMLARPSHPVGGHEQQAGFWVELRDPQDRVVYRQVLHEPVRYEHEAYPERPGELFTRTVSEPQGSFDVLVPDVPGANAVAVYGSLPEAGPANESLTARQARIASARHAPARLLGRFGLPGAEGR
jgi:hypothetical protein